MASDWRGSSGDIGTCLLSTARPNRDHRAVRGITGDSEREGAIPGPPSIVLLLLSGTDQLSLDVGERARRVSG